MHKYFNAFAKCSGKVIKREGLAAFYLKQVKLQSGFYINIFRLLSSIYFVLEFKYFEVW